MKLVDERFVEQMKILSKQSGINPVRDISKKETSLLKEWSRREYVEHLLRSWNIYSRRIIRAIPNARVSRDNSSLATFSMCPENPKNSEIFSGWISEILGK